MTTTTNSNRKVNPVKHPGSVMLQQLARLLEADDAHPNLREGLDEYGDAFAAFFARNASARA